MARAREPWAELLPELPRDADGDSIRRLVHEGSDLGEPMSVDFFVAVPDEKAGRAVAGAVEPLGYRAVVQQDPGEPTWTVYCAREMLVSYDSVVEAQRRLVEVTGPLGGRVDGWGTFGNGG
jgi:hypothetical protein